MKYTRIFADAMGESHFEDVEIEFASANFAPPAPPVDLAKFSTTTQFSFVRLSPGWRGDWHRATTRAIFFTLSGEIEVMASDGETRRFGLGSILLEEDTSGKGHTTRLVSDNEGIAAFVELAD